MPRDELRTPLRKRSLAERLWERRPSALAAASVALAALFLGGGAVLMRLPHPLAGEPVVTAALPPVEELVTGSTTAVKNEEAPAAADGTDAAASGAPEDVIDRSAAMPGSSGADASGAADQDAPARGAEEAAIIIAPHRALRPAPIDSVTDRTGDGPLPRISAAGKKPFEVYSQVTPLAVSTSARPKITIVLGGMGLNAKLTRKAIDELPGDITFGFAPYGDNLQAQVNAARARGHEILLQVPMEPVDYPRTNPGPNTLLSDAPAEQNIASLRWLMSRFAGYSGITNYMGARLLMNAEAMRPLLTEVKNRGLVYFEDASAGLSLPQSAMADVKLPVRRAGLVIDAEPTPEAINAALARLEQEAAATGTAIGTGSGLAVTIETVAEWAKTLQEKGMLLVPVSAAYKGRTT